VIYIELNNPYQKYKELSINTLTPEELLIFTYEELALDINRAIISINKKNLADAHTFITKAEKIVMYLIDILDIKYPISTKLLQIYEYIYLQLIYANTYKNEETLTQILSIVTDMKATWQQAEKEIRQKSHNGRV